MPQRELISAVTYGTVTQARTTHAAQEHLPMAAAERIRLVHRKVCRQSPVAAIDL